jgi:molybdate transport system substrate-binding protein
MKTILTALALLGVAASGASQAHGAEVHVISAGAVRAIITELAQAFQAETGHTVKLTFGTVGVVRQKLAAEPADVVIMTDAAIDQAIQQGSVQAGTRTDIARTAVGIGVREGARLPDISTPEALKQTLIATRSLTYVDPAQGATSGIHIASVLDKLGVADAVKSKTTLVPGGYPAELVAKGEVEMVAHQISEIVPVKGVTLVGPLPRELQKYTTYSAGIAAKATSPEPARVFVAFVTRPAFRPKFAAGGLDYRE